MRFHHLDGFFDFVITGWLIGGIGYQIGKIYRKS